MIRAFLVSMALALATLPAAAAELKEPEIFKDLNGVAIKGYDTVAYHTERHAVLGSAEFSHEWKDAVWHFTSAEHRDMFAADPERYAPQYGGYCAWAVAKGMTAPIDPTIFRIFDDRLYLNLNMKVHKDWLDHRGAYIARANEEWPGVLVLAK